MNIFKSSIEYMKDNRDTLYQELSKIENIKVFPSESNFITILFADLKTQECTLIKQIEDLEKKIKKAVNFHGFFLNL